VMVDMHVGVDGAARGREFRLFGASDRRHDLGVS
jgi:hypothetical protein